MQVLVDTKAPRTLAMHTTLHLHILGPDQDTNTFIGWEQSIFTTVPSNPSEWVYTINGKQLRLVDNETGQFIGWDPRKFLAAGAPNPLLTGTTAKLAYGGDPWFSAKATFTWPAGPAVIFYYVPTLRQRNGEVSVVECGSPALLEAGSLTDLNLKRDTVGTLTIRDGSLALSWRPPRRIRRRLRSLVLVPRSQDQEPLSLLPFHHMRKFEWSAPVGEMVTLDGIIANGVAFSLTVQELKDSEYLLVRCGDSLRAVPTESADRVGFQPDIASF